LDYITFYNQNDSTIGKKSSISKSSSMIERVDEDEDDNDDDDDDDEELDIDFDDNDKGDDREDALNGIIGNS